MTTTTAPYYAGLRLQIGGEAIPPTARKSLPVADPATREEIGRLPIATDDDLQRALEAAARGFARWRATSAYDRAQILGAAARLVRERIETIARILTLEEGKPLAESRLEILATADIIEWCGEEGRRAYGRVVPGRSASVRQTVLREPVGPVAAFTPWNFPAITPGRKLAGALGAGCSIIIKPSEETPATALALVDALRDAGLPDEVVNVVFGDPPHISETLIASPVIRKISFTGSIAVGKHLAGLAAKGLKRATLELGGHAPVIVTAKADLGKAVAMSASSKYRNAGQVCVSPSRFFVQDAIFADFVETFTAKASSLRIGHGLDEKTQMASLANERRRQGIASLVDDAKARGGKVRTGGESLDSNGGFFYAPTVITDVPADARVLSEEPFGPVAVITRFADLDDAITLANSLPYALAAYAFTQDVGETIRIGNEVEAGMIGINQFGIAFAELPFGGIKDSGYGSEGGIEGLEGYTITKTVTVT